MSGENNKIVRPTATFEKCSVILVDVLGTTTSVNFAKETLFPFVTKNVEDVLQAKWDDETVKSAVKQLKEGEDELDLESVVKLVKELTESNSENAGLKTLQGIIYEKGYESGDLKSHVFKDVPECFETWAKSRKVAVYSTGSVSSQEQLFSKSIEGDLTPHISKYFDQSVGPKTESDSYKKISEELAVKPEEILFVTDLIEEAKAAKDAGLSAVIIKREGNAELPKDLSDSVVVSSFKDISFENPSKRKNIDEVTEEKPSKLAKTEAEEEMPKNAELQVEKSEGESAENPKTVEDEAMEVDASSVKTVEDSKQEPKSERKSDSTEKTDEINKKTESEPVVDDVDMPVVSAVETSIKTETKTTEKSNKIQEAEDKCERKPKEQTQIEDVSVSKNIEIETTEKAAESKEVKEIENTEKLDMQAEEITKPVEEKVQETAVEGKKTDKDNGVEITEPEVVNDSKTDPETVVKPAEESEKIITDISDKTTEELEKKDTEEKPSEEKTDSVEAVSTTDMSEVKTDEEKENNIDLANRLENGDQDSADKNGPTKEDTDEEPKTNGDSKIVENSTEKETSEHRTEEESSAEDIKVKKIEASTSETESPTTVSVEV